MDLKKNAPKGEFLAYINKEEDLFETADNDDIILSWYPMVGAFCMKVNMTINNVKTCTGYKKSKHKKLNN